MEIYHFVKYDEHQSLAKLLGMNKADAILCFDLEDSIQDIFDPGRNAAFKAGQRLLLKEILKGHRAGTARIGVRVNASGTPEQALDLDALADLPEMHTIFLPKAESTADIRHLIEKLDSKNICYQEIIPVIETKVGMTQLHEIADLKSRRIKRVAFGHCDYNLDLGLYPFFHQASREYWTWIEKMVSILKPSGLELVHSPFLELANDDAFKSMLSSLLSICGGGCGQITLNFRQSSLCHAFEGEPLRYFTKIPHRLDLKGAPRQAEEYIAAFEKGNLDRGFTIAGVDRKFLSPQEYLAAKAYHKQAMLPAVHFTFVGGCFPVQGNLLFEDLFHQLLKKDREKETGGHFHVNIIRYERLDTCLDKISKYAERQPVDVLVFCLRPEPVLRMTKFFYQFTDASGRRKKTYNLPMLQFLNSEKHDLLALESSLLPTSRPATVMRKASAWSTANYCLGLLVGNNRAALKRYLKLVKEVIRFCNERQIELILMGPALRTHTALEKRLSVKLEKFMHKAVSIPGERYIKGSDMEIDGSPLFHENGIHANELYHQLIASRISGKIAEISK